MLRKSVLVFGCLFALSFGLVKPASAQWAVIDVGAIAQLIEQYITLQDQLTTMRDHLEQARQEYNSLTGGRGMERLLAGTVRNYLPADWRALTDAMNGATGAYGTLARSAEGLLAANTILKPEDLARFSERDRQQIESGRRSTAMLQALTHQALEQMSGRFQSIQQLIDAIPTAQDPKAVMDLQARTQAELGMIALDQGKLQSLYQAFTAEHGARRQRLDEMAIADVGSLRDLPPIQFRTVVAAP
jgi:type IV secretion system protein VirB5